MKQKINVKELEKIVGGKIPSLTDHAYLIALFCASQWGVAMNKGDVKGAMKIAMWVFSQGDDLARKFEAIIKKDYGIPIHKFIPKKPVF